MRISFARTTIAAAFAGAVCLSLSAGTGWAGPEMKQVAAPVKPEFNWSGFYIGLNVGGILNGYDFRGGDHLESMGGARQGGFFEDVAVDDQLYDHLFAFQGVETGIATFFVPDHSDHDGAIMGGGQVGAQWQFGHFVLGIEGDLDRTSTSATNLFRDTATTNFNGTDNEIVHFSGDTAFEAARRAETNWTAAAMAKLGYASGPWLFYVIGGGAWCDVNTTAHDIATTDFFVTRGGGGAAPRGPGVIQEPLATISNTNISKDDDTRFGWTLGGGIEVAAAKNVTFALEYRHSDYGSETYHYTSHGGVIFPGSTRVDLDSDQVTLKMNVLLNHFFWGNDSDVAGSNPASGSAERVSFANVRGGDAKDKVVQMAPVEQFSWTGFYLGGHVGGVWNDFDFGSYDTHVDAAAQFDSAPLIAAGEQPQQISPHINGPLLPFDVVSFHTPSNGSNSGNQLDDNSDSGIIGGGQLGYNYQWHNWVFGFEGDFSGSDTSGAEKFTQTGEALLFDEPFEAVTTLNSMRTVQTNWSASARGRIGYARGPLMVYATGGVAWTDVEVGNHDTATTDFLFETEFFEFSAKDQNKQKDENVVFGWTAGGGIEWAFTKVASLGLEYRHNWYDDETYHFDGKQGPIFPGNTRVSLDGDQVTFRVNFLLGRIMKP